jgi:hypothetical protein
MLNLALKLTPGMDKEIDMYRDMSMDMDTVMDMDVDICMNMDNGYGHNHWWIWKKT